MLRKLLNFEKMMWVVVILRVVCGDFESVEMKNRGLETLGFFVSWLVFVVFVLSVLCIEERGNGNFEVSVLEVEGFG
jgi:hypothetical protein